MVSLLLFFFGLIIGSFLAALSYRYPKGVSISKGRSFCPNCDKTISWVDNIPLLSYVLLHGKCRNCKKKISVRYPLIEFSTGIVFALIGLNPFLLLLSSILISIFVIDWENLLIPDDFVFAGLAVAVLYFLGTESLYANLFIGFLCALFFLFLYFLTLGRGMGLGDVKLALLLGSILGASLSLVWLLSSFLIGGLVASFLLLFKGAKLKQKIAFGPFLILGFFVAILIGDKLLYLL